MSTIIVIDDQRVNREIMAALAASVEDDVEVAAFASPLEALAFAQQKTPDLVITDFQMKPINGDEFIRRFRQLPKCGLVPAVVVTAFEDTELRDRAIEAGSTDFFQSPINHNEFQSRSRTLLALARQRQSIIDPTENFPNAADVESSELAAQFATTQMVEEMLQTVNGQLVLTADNLRDAERDLSLIADISGTAAIFLTKELRIRRYTSAAAKIFALAPSDIGQPLVSVRMKLGGFDPTLDLIELKDSAEPLEKYVSVTDARRQYLMRIVPYLDSNSHVDGAALTFTETGHGRAEVHPKLH